jgi:hypothetical protein
MTVESMPGWLSTPITAEAISGALWSSNELDRNGEQANVVDALFAIARAVDRLAPVMETK